MNAKQLEELAKLAVYLRRGAIRQRETLRASAVIAAALITRGEGDRIDTDTVRRHLCEVAMEVADQLWEYSECVWTGELSEIGGPEEDREVALEMLRLCPGCSVIPK